MQSIGLGSSWPYRNLGDHEISITASVLRSLSIPPNSGRKAQIQINLLQILQVKLLDYS